MHIRSSIFERTEHDDKPASSSGGRLTRKMGVAAAAVLLATGCSGVRGELVESGQVEEGGDQVTLAFADNLDGEEALFAFAASDLYTGDMIEGLDLHSNAPMVMTFIVPGCPVCLVEAPKLAAAAEANPDVNFVMVHSYGATDEFLAYADESDLAQENTIHIVDNEGVLWERFGVVAQPSSVLVDHDGRVTTAKGALGDDGLLRAVETVTDL